MIREPAVSGQFYPGTQSSLQKEISKYVEKDAKKENARGVMSPHAGYMYSGPVAGATLCRIQPAKTFIILGPNHTGLGKPFSIMKAGQWRTPLGEVKIDEKLSNAIMEESKFVLEDDSAHIYEHSIEVQLPFLQYLFKDFMLVPIVVSHAESSTYISIGEAIAEAIKKTNADSVIIASSDMTHYEPQAQAQKNDKEAIDAILKLDVKKFLDTVAKLDISMCGYGPVSIMMSACRKLGSTGARLVKYQTSGDITGDYSSVVGYAGVIVP